MVAPGFPAAPLDALQPLRAAPRPGCARAGSRALALLRDGEAGPVFPSRFLFCSTDTEQGRGLCAVSQNHAPFYQ